MQGASVSTAAIAADYGRQRLYEWREADKEFAEAWDDALEVGTDLLEDEVLRRAKNGTLLALADDRHSIHRRWLRAPRDRGFG